VRGFSLVLIALASLVNGCSHAGTIPDTRPAAQIVSEALTSWSTVKGQHLRSDITLDMLAAEPEWLGPEVGSPPVSIEQAVAISQRELSGYFPDVVGWRLTGVRLHSLCCPDRWFYVVSWLPDDVAGDSLSIPVLMSGRAVKLRRDDHPGPEATFRGQ